MKIWCGAVFVVALVSTVVSCREDIGRQDERETQTPTVLELVERAKEQAKVVCTVKRAERQEEGLWAMEGTVSSVLNRGDHAIHEHDKVEWLLADPDGIFGQAPGELPGAEYLVIYLEEFAATKYTGGLSAWEWPKYRDHPPIPCVAVVTRVEPPLPWDDAVDSGHVSLEAVAVIPRREPEGTVEHGGYWRSLMSRSDLQTYDIGQGMLHKEHRLLYLDPFQTEFDPKQFEGTIITSPEE